MHTTTDINECDIAGFCEIPAAPQSNPLANQKNESETIEVIYGYDALCGWCYGFSSELKKVIDTLGQKVKFTLINGGIFAGNRGLKMGEISSHIRKNMPNVTQRTGVEFGQDFKSGVLNEENYNYDSKKSSIAVMILRETHPQYVFDFSSKIQKAFFYDGLDIQSDDLYINLMKEYDIDSVDFMAKLDSQEYAKKIELEFQEAATIGFTGYPACAIRTRDGIVILNQGYMEAKALVSKISALSAQ